MYLGYLCPLERLSWLLYCWFRLCEVLCRCLKLGESVDKANSTASVRYRWHVTSVFWIGCVYKCKLLVQPRNKLPPWSIGVQVTWSMQVTNVAESTREVALRTSSSDKEQLSCFDAIGTLRFTRFWPVRVRITCRRSRALCNQLATRRFYPLRTCRPHSTGELFPCRFCGSLFHELHVS